MVRDTGIEPECGAVVCCDCGRQEVTRPPYASRRSPPWLAGAHRRDRAPRDCEPADCDTTRMAVLLGRKDGHRVGAYVTSGLPFLGSRANARAVRLTATTIPSATGQAVASIPGPVLKSTADNHGEGQHSLNPLPQRRQHPTCQPSPHRRRLSLLSSSRTLLSRPLLPLPLNSSSVASIGSVGLRPIGAQ